MAGFNHSHMFEIVESKRWESADGRTASLYGSVPWCSDEERSQWALKVVGYTVRHKKTGTIGIGRQPWATLEEAQLWLLGM